MGKIQSKQPSLFPELEAAQEAGGTGLAYVRLLFKHREKRGGKKIEWSGMDAVPPGTLLESIIEEFNRASSIPLELPFMSTIAYFSGFLCSEGVRIRIGDQLVTPAIWSVLLTASGAGKTYTSKKISEAFGGRVPRSNAASSASAASFLEEIAQRPTGLFLRDEFLEWIKQVDRVGGPMSEIKDYLLRIYDGDSVERRTKQGLLVVNEPALSLLAFTVLETFAREISPEHLVDGFLQRLNLIPAYPDKNRPWQSNPMWSVNTDGWGDQFEESIRGILPEYHPSKAALEYYQAEFSRFAGLADEMPESFFRRLMWRVHSYALIYHLLNGGAGKISIGKPAYAWAMRLFGLSLEWSTQVIDLSSGSSLSKMIEDAKNAITRMQAKNIKVTRSALLARCRAVSTAADARFVFDILGID